MWYMGSKRKYAKELIPIMLDGRKPGQAFVELFCGSCSVIRNVEGPRIANDIHPYLIDLYKAGITGWEPPKVITEEDYRYIKNNDVPRELKGFAGFYYSFGGKFLGTYRRNKKDRKGSLVNSKRVGDLAIKDFGKLISDLKGTEFYNLPYYSVKLPKYSIVYCDPPYAGTTGYTTGNFDSNLFWDYVRSISRYHKVFVSEYRAPKDFKSIWSRSTGVTLNNAGAGNVSSAVEHLFVMK